ncbi:phosphoglycolate phosphatase [Dechloromonas sp. ZY10]|uniref:phosphoglycolate phosphatase n=1 Tax=Dechloromonas aquae TaxID=2664436 RepID=UPI003527CCE3
MRQLQAILFDLDGTLADTAPDLANAANRLLQEEGRPPKPLDELRPYTSQGVRGLLFASFGLTPAASAYERLANRFLEFYAAQLCVESRLFDGIDRLLDAIEGAGLAWGIVTNKRMRYTDPLVRQLGLSPRTNCVVSGDTTAAAKPSPLPILHACELLACEPGNSIYIGDDRRDIEAGRAAGCRTIAATYGYLGDSGPPADWRADHLVSSPEQLRLLLEQHLICR